MPLTLDATVGGANSNAYTTQAEAVALAQYRVGAAAVDFLALTSDQQIQALVTATRDLDSAGHLVESELTKGTHTEWIGDKATTIQALEWPRTGAAGYAANVIPSRLKQATIELAITYAAFFASGATGDPLNADVTAANIKKTKTDVLETDYFAPAGAFIATALERFPAMVQRLIAPLLVVIEPFGGAWGAATVTRGS